MDDAQIGYLSAAELARAYRSDELSPVEVVDAIFRHIERNEPTLNAMARLTEHSARGAAKAAEAALHNGTARPLEGIPVTIKDLQPTAGLQTDSGSFITQGTIPEADAPCVTRLREAGCIMLGKTTTPEFGWKGVSQSPLHGITHNPWRHGYNAGASSAGAGVGAAAGYGPLHQGTDGAGSVRMPAHFSGVFGLKPTHGRVASWPMSNNDIATHVGPLTRTVEDAALMLTAMAGPHPWDYTSLEAAPLDYAALLATDLRGKRIGYSADLGHAQVDGDVLSLVEAAVGAFEAMGAHVEPVTPAWGRTGPELVRYFWPATYSIRGRSLPQWRDQMDPGLVAMIEEFGPSSVPEFLAMRERRFAYCTAIHQFFTEWDLLLTPAVSTAAFPAHLLQPEDWPQHPWDWLMWAEFSYPFNWSGNPACSIPCGLTPSGLPVGLQIVAPRFDDLGVLQAAAAFEAARPDLAQPWAAQRPPLVALS